MRLGAWLATSIALLSGAACSGGYPLEPTPCDDWCDVTQGAATFACLDYQPAGCVSQCEQMQLDVAPCRPQFDAVLTCYRANPGAISQQCTYDGVDYTSRPCYAESMALLACSSTYQQAYLQD